MKPNELSTEDLDRKVRSNDLAQVVDWLMSYVVKQHPEKEKLRQQWMVTDHKSPADRMAARAGWSLTADGIEKRPDGLDLAALLARLARAMQDVAPETQRTTNFAPAFRRNHPP